MRRVSIASADAFMFVFAVDDVNAFKSVSMGKAWATFRLGSKTG